MGISDGAKGDIEFDLLNKRETMKSFKMYLEEMSIAGYGDWQGSSSFVKSYSKYVIENKWSDVGTIDRFQVKKLIVDKNITYVFGNLEPYENDKDRFTVIGQIELKNEVDVGKQFNIPNLYSVSGVVISGSSRGAGYGKKLYEFIINKEKLSILGDEIQYFGARKLWASISQRSKLVVDLIDLIGLRVVERNVVLKHGDLDHEFDPRLWSYDVDKAHIRPVLKSLK